MATIAEPTAATSATVAYSGKPGSWVEDIISRQLDLTIAWSTNGTIRFVGPDAACRSLLGLSPSAVVAETIARLTFQSDQDSFEKALNRVLRLQQARDLTLDDQTLQVRLINSNGQPIACEARGQAWYLRGRPGYAEFVYTFRPIASTRRGNGPSPLLSSSSGRSSENGRLDSSSIGVSTADGAVGAEMPGRSAAERGGGSSLSSWSKGSTGSNNASGDSPDQSSPTPGDERAAVSTTRIARGAVGAGVDDDDDAEDEECMQTAALAAADTSTARGRGSRRRQSGASSSTPQHHGVGVGSSSTSSTSGGEAVASANATGQESSGGSAGHTESRPSKRSRNANGAVMNTDDMMADVAVVLQGGVSIRPSTHTSTKTSSSSSSSSSAAASASSLSQSAVANGVSISKAGIFVGTAAAAEALPPVASMSIRDFAAGTSAGSSGHRAQFRRPQSRRPSSRSSSSRSDERQQHRFQAGSSLDGITASSLSAGTGSHSGDSRSSGSAGGQRGSGDFRDNSSGGSSSGEATRHNKAGGGSASSDGRGGGKRHAVASDEARDEEEAAVSGSSGDHPPPTAGSTTTGTTLGLTGSGDSRDSSQWDMRGSSNTRRDAPHSRERKAATRSAPQQ